MAIGVTNAPERSKSSGSIINDPQVRGIFYQAITVIILAVLIYWIVDNTIENLRRANIASGYGFLSSRAGFDVGQSLISFSSDSTYGRALVVGFVNTLLVAITGIITATVIGFIVGIGRLSHNWIIAKLSLAYVEVFRNIPPLLVIFFWYSGVLSILPQARDALALPFDMYVSNRGLAFPRPIPGEGSLYTLLAFLIAVAASFLVARYARQKQMATGQRFPVLWTALGLIIGLPLVTFLATGAPLTFDVPVAGKFNLTGGSVVGPEFMSLFLALSFYTAAFIAEIVRAGIRGVSKGQSEAAHALGIRPRLTTRLVIVPQAMRIIIPPLTSQYLNLTKNSSLAVAVGYADLVAVGGTILNQTGQSIEVVSIWLIVYLSLSLATSLFMNWYNARMALVER
ncbi:amino acid ABC transporter permease [Sinorhizobium americanum]|uniref:General L-amino acid ABC transporter membrane protein /amino acid ABC transporter membrane protein 1 (PAAT family) n=1 Tax=Sinorhizobium americanum TaxID=194963 RepID=A0A1L3LLF6_9HYPH|nr:amino acid ABC transporter permease [Sinorhizobium americanum]APG84359.1 general L-amino acid transport system permease protein AapQ [Sinorhizobium americanum CCGM7]APG90907.1 general L-amino acid transport system permease protein AapQ [Sinorhizobium americanum]OAP46673.1 amino acid ABC transporter permease [Sinorhizobium americanum]TCN25805.1 general L-amino acid ABC transporter membrane protein /amino acid ABC transporter membrane protein 1 (PAAT family) [Sinorhizobium americanum]